MSCDMGRNGRFERMLQMCYWQKDTPSETLKSIMNLLSQILQNQKKMVAILQSKHTKQPQNKSHLCQPQSQSKSSNISALIIPEKQIMRHRKIQKLLVQKQYQAQKGFQFYIDQQSKISNLVSSSNQGHIFTHPNFNDDYQSKESDSIQLNRQMFVMQNNQKKSSQIKSSIKNLEYFKNLDPPNILNNLQDQFKSLGLLFQQIQTIYEYPKMEHKNYMDSILDKNNLLLVITLQSGQTVGAFTQLNFSSKPVLIPRNNPNCFLFNLTTQKFLYACRTNKTHARDANYITFGSWEIKLRVGQSYFESELGTKADCFKKSKFKGEQIDSNKRREYLFGEDAQLKQFPIKGIGIYRLK